VITPVSERAAGLGGAAPAKEQVLGISRAPE